MARKKSEDNPIAYVGCRECKSVYTVTEGQVNRGEDTFTCSCGAEINIIKYDICPHCQEPVGFGIEKGGLKAGDYIEAAVGGWLNPMSALKNLARAFGDSKAAYICYCPCCKKKVAICEECGTVNKIARKPKLGSELECDNCGESLVASMLEE